MGKTYSRKIKFYQLIVLVLFSVFFIGAGVASAAESDSGTVTDTITYTFNGDTGYLKLSGTGKLPDASSYGYILTDRIPWWSYRSDVKSITVESGITYIGDCFFYGTGATTITLPSTVTGIGEYSFAENSKVTKITLSNNITEIPVNAFYDCETLASINIPTKCTKIETEAFAFCRKLENITIPSTLVEIESMAFYAAGIKNVTIPSTVKGIGADAFGLTPFVSNATSPVIVGDGVLLKYAGTATSYTVPSNVKTIAYKAFAGEDKLTSVTIPSSVKTIEVEAFYDCKNLAKITIPKSVEKIGGMAFDLTPFDEKQTAEFVILGNGILYRYNGNSKEVTIPSTVKTIGEQAFYLNLDIQKVIVSEGVEVIDDAAFLGCACLYYYELPSTIKKIGDYSIGYYYSNITLGSPVSMTRQMITIVGPDNEVTQKYCYDENFVYLCPSLLSGVYGNDVHFSFDTKTGILTLTGTGTIPNKQNSAWANYTHLIKQVKIGEGFTQIDSNAFSDLTNVTSISLPNSLQRINTYAFIYDSEITSFVIPKGVTYISSRAFSDLSLNSLVVEEGNTNYVSIDNIIYSYDKSSLICAATSKTGVLTNIPSTVKKIESYAFYGSGLSSIDIPASVTDIYGYAFDSDSIKTIRFLGNAPSGTYSHFKYYSDEPYTIIYDPNKTGWDKVLSNYGSTPNITWKQSTGSSGGSTVADKFTATSYSLKSGSILELKLNNETSILNYTYESNNADVAKVSYDGKVLGGQNGSATIVATHKTTGEKISCTVNVTGCTYVEGENFLSSNINEFENFKSTGVFALDFANDASKNYYYMINNELICYSLYAKNEIKLNEFNNFVDAYFASEYVYILTLENNTNCVYKYSLSKNKLEKKVALGKVSAKALGVDAFGNIYVYTNRSDRVIDTVQVYNENGTFIDEANVYSKIYRFAGFDSVNGNFYVEAYYNNRTWGYDHDSNAAMAGNFSNGKLVYYNKVLRTKTAQGMQAGMDGVGNFVLFQQYWYDYKNALEMIGPNYIVGYSNMYSSVYIFDSWHYDGSGNDGVGIVFNRPTASDYDPVKRIGTNVVYNKAKESMIVLFGDRVLKEIDPQTGETISECELIHDLFSLKMIDSDVIAIEKDENGECYIEVISWKAPENIEVEKSESLRVGEAKYLHAIIDSNMDIPFEWTSSDPTIASVTSEGKVVAWKKGTATITVKVTGMDLSATCAITVIENSELTGVIPTNKTLSGKVTNNKSDNFYNVWSKPVYSYMYQDTDGSFVRVEALDYWDDDVATKLLIEYYSSDYKLKSTKTITLPLILFGGFYHTNDANYVVVGNYNLNESDATEVVRVIKYSNSWTKISEASIRGANTYVPFDAGSCRMAVDNGKLYVYTCHEMYVSGDGLHHQANMTYVIDTNTMKVIDSYYDVMNVSYGYVSHSFNEFIRSDGEYVYRVDHGDANPRGIYISKTKIGDSIIEPSVYGTIYWFNGNYGANATGASIGGLEISDNTVLIAFDSIDMTNEQNMYYGNRNVYVTALSKDLGKQKLVQITHYTDDGSITARTPQLVKVDDSHFLVMWEEYSNNGGSETKAVGIDSDGNVCTDIVTLFYGISDCQPIVTDKGLVTWYVTDNSVAKLYEIDIYNLNSYAVLDTPVVTATVGADNITLSWKAVSGATKYEIYRYGVGELEKIGETTKLSYKDTDVSDLSSYTYGVKAVGNDKESYYNQDVVVEFVHAPVLTATAVSSGIKLDCTIPDGRYWEDYYIYRKLPNDKNWTEIYSVTTFFDFDYTDTTAKMGVEYQYMVKRKCWGYEADSNIVTMKLIETPKITLANSATGVKVSYEAVSGAKQYAIYRKLPSAENWTRIATVGSTELSYIDTSVSSGLVYYYTVRAFDGSIGSSFDPNKSITYLKKPNVTLSQVNNGIKVSWTESPNCTGYKIYMKKSAADTWTQIATVNMGVTSYIYTDVTDKTTYYFTARAYRGTEFSAYDTNKSIQYIKPEPVVPAATSIVLNKTSIELATKSTFALKATVLPVDANQAVIWSSSDTNVATVSATGVVTAVRYGKAVITCKTADGKLSATCSVQTRFYDVAGSNIKTAPNYQYYYNAVYWAAENGITTGYDKIYFGPERNCTRYEMMIFLWRVAGQPVGYGDARDIFNDMDAYGPATAGNKAVAWGYATGIVKGYADGGFHPTADIVRVETLIMLYRLAGKPSITGTVKFPDCKTYIAGTDTYNAILWASNNGITSGYPDGNFQPKTLCQREHIVTFLYRYANLKK